MSTSPEFNLSSRQKRMIRESFESIEEYEDSVVLLFYGRLFELAPEVRPLFKIEIREQAHKLMEMLRTVITALDRFDELRPQFAELGRRHLDYGAKPEHYEVLSSSLLWAMGQALGPEFDPETKAAWKSVLTAISAAMQQVAAE